jgi:hypothetical protein
VDDTIQSELTQSQLNALQTAHDHVLVKQRGSRFATDGHRMTDVMARRLEFFGVAQIDVRQKPARIIVTDKGRDIVRKVRGNR